MTYSVESEENSRNAFTPNTGFSFQDQLIYRIASLEATVTNSLKRIDEKIDRNNTEMVNRYAEHEAAITSQAALLVEAKEQGRRERDALKEYADARLEKASVRIDGLEKFRTELIAKIGTAIGAVTLVWVLFGNAISRLFEGIKL